MSLFDKIKTTTDNINLENVNNKTRMKLISNIISMFKNYDLNLSYEEIETLNIPLHILMMPNKLVSAFKNFNFLFVEDDLSLVDAKILLELTPILMKIDNINERYNGRPPSKYFRMTTYMSDEEMKKFNLTNDERTYYIKTLFNSKITTMDIPKNLKSYIYTDKNFNIVFKRRMPNRLKKEFAMFFLQNYTIGLSNEKRKEVKNTSTDLNVELLQQIDFLNQELPQEETNIDTKKEDIEINKTCECNKCNNIIAYNDENLENGTKFSLTCPVCQNQIILVKEN